MPLMGSYLDGLFSTAGRVALVTGGSSGIGYGMAEAIGLAGAALVLVARDADRLASAAQQLGAHGVRVATLSADLGERDEVERVCTAAAEPFGQPDILLTAAGINLRPPFGEQSVREWDLTMAVNLHGPYLLGRHFGPSMAARGWGRIINIASQQAFRAFGNSGGYGVSKAAITGLTRSQAEAWSARGVCCNTVVPGFVHTALTAHVSPERSRTYAGRTMIGRNGEPADFAGTAVYLAGRASDYITAQVLYVDGGFAST
jgi:NAD(P)-dependent dehydrogenase (short-subunit alcohol dehydrogenase family)